MFQSGVKADKKRVEKEDGGERKNQVKLLFLPFRVYTPFMEYKKERNENEKRGEEKVRCGRSSWLGWLK